MSNNQNVRVSIDERKIGKAAGNAVGNKLDSRLKDIERNTKDISRELDALQDDVQQLERRMTEIERTKAKAEREATESIRDQLKSQFEEKKRQFEEKKESVLEDYQSSIRRLKDRFINSIPGQSEGFDQVVEEFETAVDQRRSVVESARSLGSQGAGAIHEYRRRRLEESRDALTGAVDDFLEDRQETADTIDSLQTTVPGVNGDLQVNIPFWVVGIEKNGREEIHVLPIQTWAESVDTPTPRSPYSLRHEPHPTHDYYGWTDAVEEYVQRTEVRDRLASGDPVFADASSLRNGPGTTDRFIRALAEYELGHRTTTGSDGPPADAAAQGQHETAEARSDD